MKISTLSQYGLRAMVYLSQKNGLVSVKEISLAEKIPFDYLGKIFLKLKKAGLVKVKRGQKGGYKLAQIPPKITLGQIIRALDGSMAPIACLDKKDFCQRKNCQTRGIWQALNQSLNQALDKVTLADSIK